MYENELISVIVPVYNIEKYLEKCVTSIVSQTYSNLEIILVDDGSTDQSGFLCDVYAEKDDRIHVIHKANAGLSDARNVGIENSKGKYISFVDSDDYIDSAYVESLYHTLMHFSADISICNFSKVYEQGRTDDYVVASHAVITGKQAIQKLSERDSIYYIVAWNKLYKRELFANVKFPVGRINEDEFVIHRLFGQCDKIACLKDVLYFYYQRPDSIMGKINKKDTEYCLNKIEFMLDRVNYLQTIHMEPYAVKIYKKAVFLYYNNVLENKNDTELKQKKNRMEQIEKEFWKNYEITKFLSLKQQIQIFMILRSHQFYKMYVYIKSILRKVINSY